MAAESFLAIPPFGSLGTLSNGLLLKDAVVPSKDKPFVARIDGGLPRTAGAY